jgi:uncharacterized Zn finger protein
VYRREVEPAILRNDGHTYRSAIEWLEKIRTLLVRLGREEEFEGLVWQLRETYRAKRNMIKRLDERGWNGKRPQTAPHACAKLPASEQD